MYNISIRFGSKLHNVGIPICTNCVPSAADLFLFCYERGFMLLFCDILSRTLSEIKRDFPMEFPFFDRKT